jgi:chemotaxis protein methyltransferase CheR
MRRQSVPDEAVRRLSSLLHERVGLRPASEGQVGLHLALSARLEALSLDDAGAYVERLERGDEDELRALLPLVTVGKTDFFRDSNQFRALRAHVFPEALGRARQEMRRLRVWSAGCATGEEPYSLAMLASDLGIEPQGIDLLATDVNPMAVEDAIRGRFPRRRFAAVMPEYLSRFFVEDGDCYQARDELREYIRFAVHNLAQGHYPWSRDGGSWDVILCRNVIIYFDRPTTARVVGRFFEGLRPGGYLCLGYSESLYRITTAFELVDYDNAFLYRKPAPRLAASSAPPTPSADEKVARLRLAVEAMRQRTPPPFPAPTGEKAATRPPPQASPANLPVPRPPLLPKKPVPAVPAQAEPAQPQPAQPVAVADPVQSAARLLENGEFENALKALNDSLARSPSSLALLITRANVLTVMGRHEEARRVYREVIAAEPLCAEAHLFLGIACFEAGKAEDAEASRELTRALFLEPELGLAHYYAGRIAERNGDLAGARRSYRNAASVCQGRTGWTPLIGYFPDLPSDPGVVARAARYALAALEEV